MKKLFRVLFFQFSKNDCLTFTRSEFFLGLFITWIVGMGRYWDNPRANFAQQLGLGSVVYIFVLALLIWGIVYPIRKVHWNYFSVVTFISLVSLPAILYAIPVERFMELESARMANIYFLQIVAAWRVILLFLFLKRYAQLSIIETVISALLPLTLIVVSLTALNLEHVVFEIMAGISETKGTANDGAYYFLVSLTVASAFILPFLIIGYSILIYRSHRNRIKQKAR